jgi:selenium metabolism protein YedF
MIRVDAMGDACPIPVVKTKNAIKELNGPGQVEVLVDNEIAVQNLTKMAQQKQYQIQSEKLGEQSYRVLFTIGEVSTTEQEPKEEEPIVCRPDQRKNIVVAVTSSKMGEGSEELGEVLMKGFLYALSQQDVLPSTILFYNGGAKLTCGDSPSIEDLRSLEAQGVEILTCGTCLNYYQLTEKLAVGGVTNMYAIVEKLTQADLVIRP